MKRFGLILLCVMLLTTYAYSTDNKQVKTSKNLGREKLQKMPSDSFVKIYPKKASKLSPAKIKAIEKFNSDKPKIQKKNETTTLETLPEKIAVPGEFDESQAVLISWPSFALDTGGNVLDPLVPGIGLRWIDDSTYYVTEIDSYILDLFDDSPYPPLWGKLTQAIQRECQVWIRVSAPEDTTALKAWMAAKYSPLTNYKFITDPNGENAFWLRDFGPYGVYVGDEDSLAFVKMEYYPDRPIDNNYPNYLAELLNLKIYHSNVETEGGNFMTDGWGRNIYSSVIYYSNLDTIGSIQLDDNGINYKYKKQMTIDQVNQEYNTFLASNNRNVLPHLWCDGGTGHIDLYLKLIDDETILTTDFPAVFNNKNFDDYNSIKTNVDNLSATKSTYNRNFKILKLPLPTNDFGTYSATDCESFNEDARNYINGLIVNKSFIFPTYSNNVTGNKNGDAAAVNRLKTLLPGYNIVPIDARILSPLGGAIHCITMQIPADNPVKIWHPSITGYQPLQSQFNIITKLHNRSGIQSAQCKWRKSTESEWHSFDLTETDGQHIGSISGSNLMESDSIEYYIEVTSNNGKTMRRPITAPEGYYTFYFQDLSSVEQINQKDDITELYPPQPNPASDYSSVRFSLSAATNLKISLVDILGKEVSVLANGLMQPGEYNTMIETGSLTSGLYMIVMTTSDGVMKTQKMYVIEN